MSDAHELMTVPLEEAVHKSLRVFAPCPECDGEGLITIDVFDRDNGWQAETDLCGECHGTGTMVE